MSYESRADVSMMVAATACVASFLFWVFSKDPPKRQAKRRYKKPDVAA